MGPSWCPLQDAAMRRAYAPCRASLARCPYRSRPVLELGWHTSEWLRVRQPTFVVTTKVGCLRSRVSASRAIALADSARGRCRCLSGRQPLWLPQRLSVSDHPLRIAWLPACVPHMGRSGKFCVGERASCAASPIRALNTWVDAAALRRAQRNASAVPGSTNPRDGA